MRRKKTQSLGEVIHEYFRSMKIERKVAGVQVVRHWKELMGTHIVGAVKSINFSNGRLYIQLNSSVIRNELFMLRGEMIEAVNKRVGSEAVKEIILQ